MTKDRSVRITADQIREWRELSNDGMSVIGEYTPSEFWDALDEIERLRAALDWISEARTDDAWQLRDKANEALDCSARWLFEGRPTVEEIRLNSGDAK